MSLSYPQGYAPARKPHCGVLATAICAGVSFEAAWEIIQRQGGYPASWKGATYPGDRLAALRAFGVEVVQRRHVPARHLPRLAPEYVKQQGLVEGCTVATFVRRFARPGVIYMVQVSGHVVTIRDGIVADQCGLSPAARHWCGKRRVQTSWEVLA